MQPPSSIRRLIRRGRRLALRALATGPRPEFSMYQLVTGVFDEADSVGGRIMLDVGAQRGQYARQFAGLGFDVRAFEASPPNYEDLVRRMAAFPNVTPVHAAVSDTDADEVKFFYSEEFIGVNSLKVNSSYLDDETYAVVQTVRLATHLGDDLPRVDVIKTDIEGADLLALKGFDFARHQPRLVVAEYGGRSAAFDYNVSDLVEHLRSFGYVAWCSNYQSGTGLPYSVKTGEQSKVALLYFGEFDRCPEPNWGDVLFFHEADRSLLAEHVNAFSLDGAVVDLEP